MRYLFFIILFCSCKVKQDNSTSATTDRDTVAHSNTANKNDSIPVDTASVTNVSKYNYSFSVTNGKISLSLQDKLDENKLKAALGNSQSFKIDTLKNADTHTGSIIRTYDFGNIILQYFQPADSRNKFSWLMKVTVSSPVWKTEYGIRIGNTSDDIILAYPSVMIAKDGKSTQNNGMHIVTNSGDDTKQFEFTIRNGKVSKIGLAYIIN